jgi:hypothetical protein
MSKRSATGSRPSRKRTKGGASYGIMDIDPPDVPPGEVEDIRVWNVTKSEKTGRVSATRRNYQHFYASSLDPSHETQPSTIEDAGAPTDLEPNKQPPAVPVVKPKRVRVRTVKENDSVSSIPTVPSKLIIIRRRPGWRSGSWGTLRSCWMSSFARMAWAIPQP